MRIKENMRKILIMDRKYVKITEMVFCFTYVMIMVFVLAVPVKSL